MRISRSAIAKLLLGSSLALTLSACESSGGLRMASVGQSAGQSAADDSGSGSGSSDTGTSGSAGGTASSGASGSGSGSGGAQGSAGLSRIPVDGVVGPDGVGGTGVASNTGDPSQSNAASPILVTAGNALLDASDRGNTARGPANENAPNSAPFTGTVTQVIASTSQALVRSGDGSSYLVDDLAAAPGSAVTVGAGQGTLVGGPGSNPLIGVSVVSPSQTAGSAATLGAGTNGNLLTANVPSNGALATTPGSLSSATGNLANANAGDSQVLGGSQPATLGVSALSPTQSAGSVLTAGVASNGNTAAVNGTTVASPTTGGNLLGGTTGTGTLGTGITVPTVGTAPTASANGANGSGTLSLGPVAIN